MPAKDATSEVAPWDAPQPASSSTEVAPWDASPTPTAPPPPLDFSQKLKGQEKEGVYKMMSSDGQIRPVSYSRVMEASKSGWAIDPEDRYTFAKDRVAELKKLGKDTTINPDTDLPKAYTTVGAAPKKWSKDWLKSKAFGAREDAVNALPTIFGITGAALAGIGGLPSGPGDVAAIAGGAAAGGAVGEAERQRVEDYLHPFDRKMTPKQKAIGIAEQAGIQGVSELTGQALGAALKPATKYFEDTALASKTSGIPLLPSEAEGKAPSYVEKFSKGSVITGPKMDKFREVQNTKSKAAVEKLANGISSFRGNPERLGNMVQDAIEEHKGVFRKEQKALYDDIRKDVGERTIRVALPHEAPSGLLDAYGNPLMKTTYTYVDKVVDNVMPSTKNLKVFAKEELKKLDQVEKVLDPSLLSSSRRMLETLASAPDRMTYDAIASARSDALSKARELEEALAGKESGLAKKIASLFDETMIDAAEKSGIKGLPEKVRAANAFTAEEHRIFNQDLVRKVVETKKPEAIATLIKGNNIGNQELRDLFKILPEELHQPVQRQVIMDTLRQSTNLNSKIFKEGTFAGQISKIGDERGQIIFGKNWKNIKELSRVLSNITGSTGPGMTASLNNLAVIKNLALTAAIPLGLASTGHGKEGLESAGGEVATLWIIATAMTNPEAALRMLKAAKFLVHYTPYVGGLAYNEVQGKKNLREINKEAQQRNPSQPDNAPNAGAAQ